MFNEPLRVPAIKVLESCIIGIIDNICCIPRGLIAKVEG